MTGIAEGLRQEIEEGLRPIPTVDAHTHLTGGQLGARGLHEIMLYHTVISDLYSSGCPSGARLTQFPDSPNFSLAGYSWHNFYPSNIRQADGERLDMLPLNKQVGFFSDAYVAEWSYAKLAMVRRQLAHVRAGKIVDGQYSPADALSIAEEILLPAPLSLCGLTPRT